jgi:tetratricopeptide (TPR) repeat protein
MDNYFNLGSHTRLITTSSPEAQVWFDRGLNWCFGFNQEEGVVCFRKALEYDPECAMAYWGIAYGAGPFYNMPWRDFCANELTECTKLCYDSVTIAQSLVIGKSGVEADLIHALAQRFQSDHSVSFEEFDTWDDSYADAMRNVYHKHPQDLDVMALFVEAMMTRTPWKLWNVKTNMPADGADTLECIAVLEKAIEQATNLGISQHPAILHLHIHCLEMSPHPEKSLESANTLATLCPDAGHMIHMPGHAYVLCGLYEEAKIVSESAIEADRKYLDYAGPENFYTSSRCHDLHLMMYTCMFLGQFQPAMEAAEEMCATLTPDVLDLPARPYLAMTLEGYYSMQVHVLVRFGKWQEIIDAQMPQHPALYCVSTAMWHYAKGISYGAMGQFTEAELERTRFYESLKVIPEQRKFFNNPALDVLAIADNMLNGELEYHKGNHHEAYAYLRESVRLNDNLAYTEPWAWMHPPRHALGALLMEQGHYTEAEAVYRTDLGLVAGHQRCSHHPDNVWALHGLAECLHRRNAIEELSRIMPTLNSAQSKADIAITSSCCCRRNTVSPARLGHPDPT